MLTLFFTFLIIFVFTIFFNSVKEMAKDENYLNIPTLLLTTRSRQIDPTDHLLLFNPYSGWTQKENITNVGVDTLLIGKATGGIGNGIVAKRIKKVDGHELTDSDDNAQKFLNKGDDVGIDNVVFINVRSMYGKLSSNIMVQLEAPIIIKNNLKDTPIYLR